MGTMQHLITRFRQSVVILETALKTDTEEILGTLRRIGPGDLRTHIA